MPASTCKTTKRSRERLFDDTPASVEEVVLERYRSMPAWQKLAIVDDANRTARQLALAGLRSRHPGESLPRLRRRLLGLILGETLATRLYGELGKFADTVVAGDSEPQR
jgi:hypothetical protein